MKQCVKCGLIKDETEYSWRIRGVKNTQAVIPVAPENGCNITKEIKKREEARQFVDTYMSTHPCVDCNETDPDSLTFDHVRDVKKTTIANMVNLGYSIRRCNPK